MVFINLSDKNRDRNAGQQLVLGSSVGQNHRFLERDTLVAQSGSAWTDTAQGVWDDSVFRDINNELSSYGKS